MIKKKYTSNNAGFTTVEIVIAAAAIILSAVIYMGSMRSDGEVIVNQISDQMNKISSITTNNSNGDSSLPDNPDEEAWTEEQKCKYYGGTFNASVCSCPEGRELSNGWCLKKSSSQDNTETMKTICLATNQTWDEVNKKCIYDAKDKCEYGFIWSGTTCVAADESQLGDTDKLAFALNVDETGYIVVGSQDAVELSIPPTYKSLPVVAIGPEAFKTTDSLRNITIPKSITSIGDDAFNGLIYLTDVRMEGDSITLGHRVFQNCTSLAKINMEKVMSVGDFAFANCTSLKEIGSIDQIKTIGASAFADCKSLIYIWHPNEGFEKAGENAFKNVSLELFLDKITNIHEGAFEKIGLNANKDTFVIPYTVKSIGSNAFAGNTFKYIKFEDGSEDHFDNHGTEMFGKADPLVMIPKGTYEIAANKGCPLNLYPVWDGTAMVPEDFSINSGKFKQLYRYKGPSQHTDSSSVYYYDQIYNKYDYKFGGMIIPNGARMLTSEYTQTEARFGNSNVRYYEYVGAIANLPLHVIIFPPTFTDFGNATFVTNFAYSDSSNGSMNDHHWGTMRDLDLFDVYFTNKEVAPTFRNYAFYGIDNYNWESAERQRAPFNPGSLKNATLHVPEDEAVCKKYKDAVTKFFRFDTYMADHVICDVTDEMIAEWYN